MTLRGKPKTLCFLAGVLFAVAKEGGTMAIGAYLMPEVAAKLASNYMALPVLGAILCLRALLTGLGCALAAYIILKVFDYEAKGKSDRAEE